ncbi:MAG TPA: ABC transporter permease, partial [Propionicimonas sp.]
MKYLGRAVSHRLFWPVVMLVALLAINVIAVPGFLSITVNSEGHLFGSIIDIVRNGAPTLIIAVGMTLVIATRGIDLSVGSVCAISGAVACSIILGSPNPDDPAVVGVAVLAAIGLSLLLGVWNGFLVAVLGIQPIIATLILMTAGRGIAMLITEGNILTVESAPFKFLGSGFVLGIPVATIFGAVIIIFAALLTRRTALGLLIESVGINPEASRLAGVRSRGIIWGAYIASGILAGVAGVIYASNIKAADANAAGLFIELYAILAVVLGGTSLAGGKFSIAGTVIGVLIIQTLDSTILFLGVPSAQSPVVFALVVVAVVMVQSPRVRRGLRSMSRSVRARSTADRERAEVAA